MSYQVKPATDYMVRTDIRDLQAELKARETARQEAAATTTPSATPSTVDQVDLGSDGGRQLMVNSLRSRFGGMGESLAGLVGNLFPATGGLGGLYNGVGQLSAPQVQSLIDKYV